MNGQKTPPALTDCTLTLTGRVATLTLNRDDVRNELTGTRIADDIESVVDWLNGTPIISVLVITGAGRSFSAGGNIKDMRSRKGTFSGDALTVQQNYRIGIQRIPLALERLEVPVIAAINGAAIGAGLDLACMCDIRIAASTAVLAESFINVGIIPGDGGAWFLQRLIGYQRAAELTFSGRRIDAHEALRLGIVMEVVDLHGLSARAAELAQGMAANAPQVLRLTKRLMKMAQRASLQDFLDMSAMYQGGCHNSAEHAEAVDALIAGRKPEFDFPSCL